MTRQAGMQPGATSSKAGKFQRAKPLAITAWRAPMPDPDEMLFWDPRGHLFFDEELTEPAGLVIVSLTPPEM